MIKIIHNLTVKSKLTGTKQFHFQLRQTKNHLQNALARTHQARTPNTIKM